MKTGATRKAEKKSGGGGTVGGTSAFNADPIAERALIVVSDVFPRDWKRFNDKRMVKELRRLIATVKSSEEDLGKRQRCLSALDNLAWHTRTKARLFEPAVGALDLLFHLSFSSQLDPRDAPLRSLALNTLNKMALSNTQALCRAGILEKLIVLAQQQMKIEGDSASIEEELRQKVLLGVANILLTYANDKTFRALLAVGAPGAWGENGTSALDLLLSFLNDPKFNLSLRGSAGMALMKLCEMCRRGEESWAMVRRKVADSNTMKNLVLLLLRKDDDNPTKPASASTTTSDGPAALPGVDEAAFTNKAMVLDVLYALSNLDSFENEVDAGDMGERVIKAGGCVITCALLNRLAAEQQQQQQQPIDAATAAAAEHDARTKARVEVIRAAVGLLSSMAFVTANRKAIAAAKGVEAIVAGIKACNGDNQTISYGCRALYVLDKHQQSFKVKEKNESEASGADGQTATQVASSGAEEDEMALSPEDRQFCEKGRERMEAYADELIPVLIDIIRKSKPATVGYPSDEAYMLRHICLLFFLFSSIPSILHKMVTSAEYRFTDVLTELLADTVVEIQVNALAVIANFVETVESARLLCQSPRLLEVLRRYEKLEMDENNAHLLENASYAMQGLKQKVPDELDRLGISFASLALREEELASAEHGAQLAKCGLCEAKEARRGDFPVCGACKQVAYCTREHQKQHWRTHKPHCRPASRQ